MFASNQLFLVTCTERDLAKTLDFVLELSRISPMEKRKLAYQRTSNGGVAIGYGDRRNTAGWQPFPVDDPTAEMLAPTIIEMLKDENRLATEYVKSCAIWGGSHSVGYLVEAPNPNKGWDDLAEEFGFNTVKNILFVVRKHEMFYAK